jgi:hypothetical protein
MKTLIGLASEVVEVNYALDDGNIYGMAVTFNGIDVTGILTQNQYDDLELECYANERKIEIERTKP